VEVILDDAKYSDHYGLIYKERKKLAIYGTNITLHLLFNTTLYLSCCFKNS